MFTGVRTVIELAPQRVHGANGQTDLQVWVVWLQNGTSLRLVVSYLGTFAVSFPPPPFVLTGT